MPANPSTAIGLPWLGTGALFAALGVAAGAFGAHGLRAMLAEPLLLIYETAVRYQMYHALALVALGALAGRLPPRAITVSGSLYLLVLTGTRPLGILTPIGGSCFIAGWLWLAVSAWRAVRTPEQPRSRAS